MTLDPRFIICSDLQELFRDKDTGEPLAYGEVTFYQDENRTVKKPVYQLTGSPPNYSYSPLPNPCILSGIGTFMDDDGNDIVPYYFPYEGTPDDSTGEIELYYVTVYGEDGDILQFTRQAWPNFTANNVLGTGDVHNFIPNGQFLAHNDIISSTVPPVTNVSGIDVQYVAQGGWAFKRTHGGASTFNNSFTRITTGISGFNDFPRYVFNFVCVSFSIGDQVRDFGIEFPDVFKFCSGDPEGEQDYTFLVGAESNDSNTYTMDVRLIYNYGTGGSPSPQEDISIGTMVIGPSSSYKLLHIEGFPVPEGTLGTNNDDYVAIMLRGPASPWNVSLTDYALAYGNVSLNQFPVQTNAEMLSVAIPGSMAVPSYTGRDMYLPLVLTQKGMVFDHSQVGRINAYSLDTLPEGELLCNGDSYRYSDYSSIGIPYARLGDKLIADGSTGTPKYGTGYQFVTCQIGSGGLYLYSNKHSVVGTVAPPLPGTSGFTMTDVVDSVGTGLKTGRMSDISLISQCGAVGTVTAATAGTSPFTVTMLRNNAETEAVFTITNIAAAAGLAGDYFTFRANPGNVSYYVWFTVDGVGANPAPGGTGIQIALLSSETAGDVAHKIGVALSGGYCSNIATVAASAMSGGDYFTFGTSLSSFYVWYTIDGAGSDPLIPGAIGIEVALDASDTSTEVAQATLAAVNGAYFGVPDLRGVILRGHDLALRYDLSAASRFSLNSLNLYGNHVGTYELDSFGSHNHNTSITGTVVPSPGFGGPSFGYDASSGTTTFTSTNTGEAESRPVNVAVNYTIKY